MVIGCKMQPVPLSAQVGSTVVISLDTILLPEVGHGGTEYHDPQRGELVFALGDYPDLDPGLGGIELTTRMTLLLGPPPRASLSTLAAAQYLSIVDLVNPGGEPLPLGVQPLYVSLLRGGVYTEISQQWEIAILPGDVEVEPGGEWITGAPTPLEVWVPDAWMPIDVFSDVEEIIPQPSIRVELLDPATNRYLPAWSAVLDVQVPDDVITVNEATTSIGTRTTAWLEDLGVDAYDNRTIRVSSVGLQQNVYSFDLVFALKDDTQPLELADVSVDVVRITDEVGDDIPSVSTRLSIR
jgi:hypothetical protein